jgi:hypothetical protein
VYGIEERLPHVLGRLGQYPAILIHKPGGGGAVERAV